MRLQAGREGGGRGEQNVKWQCTQRFSCVEALGKEKCFKTGSSSILAIQESCPPDRRRRLPPHVQPAHTTPLAVHCSSFLLQQNQLTQQNAKHSRLSVPQLRTPLTPPPASGSATALCRSYPSAVSSSRRDSVARACSRGRFNKAADGKSLENRDCIYSICTRSFFEAVEMHPAQLQGMCATRAETLQLHLPHVRGTCDRAVAAPQELAR
jgi:hypothetical protein